MASAKKKRPSGANGAHKSPRIILSLTAEQAERWREAAESRGLTLSAWIRLACDRQVERKTLG